jgi:ATP-binding cassette subfamily B protein
LGLTIVEAVSQRANRLFSGRLHDDLNLRITSDILTHAAELDVACFEDPHVREIIDRAQQDAAGHFSKFVQDTLVASTNVVQTVSLIGILMSIEPLIVLVLGPFAFPYLLFQWRLAKKHYSTEHFRATKRRWTSYFASRLMSQQSVAEVKLLDLAPLLIEKFRSLMAEFRDQDRKTYLRSFAGGSVFAVLTTVAFYAIFTWIVMRALRGALTIGDLAIFAGVTSRLRTTLEKAILAISSAMEQTLHISNLIQFLAVRPHIAVSAGAVPSTTRGEIELKNVSFTYPGSRDPALSGVSLHINPGETVALVGENGAGKTTLVKLIARLYDPDDGSITLEGLDLRELSLVYLQSQISFVFQGFGRYEATAADNIAYGDWRRMLYNRELVERIALLADVHDMIKDMPQGYDTMLGRMFGEYDLSGGQWQKIAVARAFARDASLLILDEPTSNLDVRAEYELFCRFRDLTRGRTTILISHRFSTVSMADRIIVMERGRIVESGTHHDLLAQAGTYASLYNLHQRQRSSSVAE